MLRDERSAPEPVLPGWRHIGEAGARRSHVDATRDRARQHVCRTERRQGPDRIDQRSRPRRAGEHGVAVERSVHGADRASQSVLRRHRKPPCLRFCEYCIGRDDADRGVAGGMAFGAQGKRRRRKRRRPSEAVDCARISDLPSNSIDATPTRVCFANFLDLG